MVRLETGLNPKITMFQASWGPGHNSTDYPRYMSIPAGADEVYKVTTYQSAYEPYVIMSKRVTWCVLSVYATPLANLRCVGATNALRAMAETRQHAYSRSTSVASRSTSSQTTSSSIKAINMKRRPEEKRCESLNLVKFGPQLSRYAADVA